MLEICSVRRYQRLEHRATASPPSIYYIKNYLIGSSNLSHQPFPPLQQRHIPIPLSKHTQRLHREDELVIRVRDHTALVEYSLNSFLQPLPVGLLSAHDE